MKNTFESIVKGLGCELWMYFYTKSGNWGRYQVIVKTPKQNSFEYICHIDTTSEDAEIHEAGMCKEFETNLKEMIA